VPKISFRYSWLILGALLLFRAAHALAADKPNVLVIFGDDIGWFNISAYNDGMMGYRPTSTASQKRVPDSPTGTDSRAAPQGARR
jgi:arylsulfatase A-like enzyme